MGRSPGATPGWPSLRSAEGTHPAAAPPTSASLAPLTPVRQSGMPQMSLTDPPDDALRITIRDLVWRGDPAFVVEVQRRQSGGDFATVSSQRYAGLAVDFLLTTVKDTTAAWLYGEPRDVKRAADSTARAARRHAEAHEDAQTG